MTKPFQFRVYPEKRGGQYYNCIIFPSRKAMLLYDDFQREKLKMPRREIGEEHAAQVRYWTALKTDARGRFHHRGRSLGEIHFYGAKMRVGIVAHEAAHATLFYARANKVRASKLLHAKNSDHEHSCWVLGNINRQIWLGHARREKVQT